MMKVLTEILTILNLCSVQFYGIFDSHISLHQSLVPAVILSKEVKTITREAIETLKSIQPPSFPQKCSETSTAIVAFISVNDRSSIKTEPKFAFQNEATLNRYGMVWYGMIYSSLDRCGRRPLQS
jgi:hypothetical protein